MKPTVTFCRRAAEDERRLWEQQPLCSFCPGLPLGLLVFPEAPEARVPVPVSLGRRGLGQPVPMPHCLAMGERKGVRLFTGAERCGPCRRGPEQPPRRALPSKPVTASTTGRIRQGSRSFLVRCTHGH